MEKINDYFSNPASFWYDVRKHKKDIIFYSFGLLFVLLIFIFISSKTYSFIMVLASTVQMLGFLMLINKITSNKSCSGLSLNTIISYAIVLFSRLTATVIGKTYLPEDSSGDWFYQLTEFISFMACVVLIYLITYVYRDTRDTQNDKIQFYVLMLLASPFALLFKPSLIKNSLLDFNWAFSMYLETIAIFPQINMFQSRGGKIDSFTGHYVAICGLSRLLSLIFWFDTYPELAEENSFFSRQAGRGIILTQILQLVLMCDYYYLYFKSIFKGEKGVITIDI